MRLEELLAADPVLPKWEEWRDLPPVMVPKIPGFRVEVRLLDVPGTVAAARQGENRPEAHMLATLRQAVTNWEGLTVGGLKKLLPKTRFRSDIPDDTPFPYDKDNLIALLRRSFIFINWVLRVLELRQSDGEELEKNSSTTPPESSTQQPETADGADGKNSSTA